jgi:hypothetical protein
MKIDEFMRALNVPRPTPTQGARRWSATTCDVDEADRDLPADEIVHGRRHALVEHLALAPS